MLELCARTEPAMAKWAAHFERAIARANALEKQGLGARGGGGGGGARARGARRADAREVEMHAAAIVKHGTLSKAVSGGRKWALRYFVLTRRCVRHSLSLLLLLLHYYYY